MLEVLTRAARTGILKSVVGSVYSGLSGEGYACTVRGLRRQEGLEADAGGSGGEGEQERAMESFVSD